MTPDDERPMTLCDAFFAIADLSNALGAGPLNKHPGCWAHQVDEQWHIEVNGHTVPMRTADGCCELQPFHAAILFNGWPAGIINPRGGTIAAGEAANEDAFIAAVRAATLRATQ